MLSSRLIGLGRYLCWDLEIVSHMRVTRRRSMMILQWSTCLMCYSFWLPALLFTLSSTNATRAGTRGFSLRLQAVFTCLVRAWIFPIVFFNCIRAKCRLPPCGLALGHFTSMSFQNDQLAASWFWSKILLLTLLTANLKLSSCTFFLLVILLLFVPPVYIHFSIYVYTWMH